MKRNEKIKENEFLDTTSFLEIMGNTPLNRVLDFLIENDRESWTMFEISKNAKVGYSTLKIILPKLLEQGLVIVPRKIGMSKLYTMDKESPITNKIYSLYKAINLLQLEKV